MVYGRQHLFRWQHDISNANKMVTALGTNCTALLFSDVLVFTVYKFRGDHKSLEKFLLSLERNQVFCTHYTACLSLQGILVKIQICFSLSK